MQLRLIVLVITVIACELSVFSISRSDAASPQTPSAVSGGQTLTNNSLSTDWTWATEPWTGDDRPFALARAKIDKQFVDVSDVHSVVTAYESAAHGNPSNALDQFEWAYACYCQDQNANAHGNAHTDAPLLALATAAQPHCYNYDRLRLILMPGWEQERNLAERLLQQDPSDIEVKDAYAQILVISKNNADNTEALKIAREMVSAGQNVPNCYDLLGFVCGSIAVRQNLAQYYREAIAANDQFLTLTRADNPKRPVIMHVNSYLERRLQNLP